MNERQRILDEIRKLESNRCSVCARSNDAATKCNCRTAVQIRELGDQLLATTAERKRAAIESRMEAIRKEGINMESYSELRHDGFTLEQIAIGMGVSVSTLTRWKTNGFVKGKQVTQPVEVEEPVDESEERRQRARERKRWRGIAESNGIGYKTFSNRLDKGYSYEEAATIPVNRERYSTEDSWKASLNGINKRAYGHRIKSGWPSEIACVAPIGTKLSEWLEKEKVES